MPRKARKFVRSPFYHVMAQGIKKENIFSTEEDIEKYLALLCKYKEDFFIDVLAYCIMPNHIHLLVHTPKTELLSKFMHKLNSIYAMDYNNNNNRVGYVFRDRFKTEEITDIKYLSNCIFYIHNNPVKAGLCDSQSHYKYSSYKEFINTPRIINPNILYQALGKNIEEKIQSNSLDNMIIFLDTETSTEERAKEIIQCFTKIKNKDISEILNNYNDRKELLIQLHIKNNISYRCIEKILNIKRKNIPTYLFAQRGQA